MAGPGAEMDTTTRASCSRLRFASDEEVSGLGRNDRHFLASCAELHSYDDPTMEMFESRRYRAMERITNLMLLNAAWLVASLPLVTIFPATAGALRGRPRPAARRRQGGAGVLSGVICVRTSARRLVIGLVWYAIGSVLLFDYLLLGDLPAPLQLPLFVIFSLGTAAFLLTSVYLFPVMVGYRNDWRSVIRNSFLVSVSQLHTSIACLLVIFAAGFLAAQLPITLLLTTSTTAYVVHAVCAHGLRRVEGMQDTSLDAPQRDPFDQGPLEQEEHRHTGSITRVEAAMRRLNWTSCWERKKVSPVASV